MGKRTVVAVAGGLTHMAHPTEVVGEVLTHMATSLLVGGCHRTPTIQMMITGVQSRMDRTLTKMGGVTSAGSSWTAMQIMGTMLTLRRGRPEEAVEAGEVWTLASKTTKVLHWPVQDVQRQPSPSPQKDHPRGDPWHSLQLQV